MTSEQIVPIKEHQKLFIFYEGHRDIEVNVSLEIPNTGIDIYGLILANHEHKGIVKVNIEHKAKNTKSFVFMKGLLIDDANVKFHGLVKLNKGAKGADAWLSCYYLLLDNAKGQAIPSLEILENDVKAGHATTASRIKEKEVFYLMSRGLTKEQAISMLLRGFIVDVLQYMPKDLHRRVDKMYYGR